MARKKKEASVVENAAVGTDVALEKAMSWDPGDSEKVDVVTYTADNLKLALEDVSLRQVALATGCTYNVLLKASKAPIEGQMYDPDIPNLTAVAKAMYRKCGDVLMSLDWEDMIKEIQMNAPVREAGGVSIDSFEIDDYVKLRDIKDAEGTIIVQPVYQLKIRTGTHVVLVPVKDSTVPRVMSYDTFIHQGAKKYDIEEAKKIVEQEAE